jgi:hypothetical protein
VVRQTGPQHRLATRVWQPRERDPAHPQDLTEDLVKLDEHTFVKIQIILHQVTNPLG